MVNCKHGKPPRATLQVNQIVSCTYHNFLYDWAGGKENLEHLTAVFYDKVLNDDFFTRYSRICREIIVNM
jgi:hypothetical protein